MTSDETYRALVASGSLRGTNPFPPTGYAYDPSKSLKENFIAYVRAKQEEEKEREIVEEFIVKSNPSFQEWNTLIHSLSSKDKQ